ncbi:UPF0149 family protein [Nevskia sp.]|uniref:UPF0149 family protein n=1 Tax=Nevskia sp. TaxID=1929292 RepID=UPI002600F665|nr:UPF0149 family protein [Nevskia sp.]
MTNPFDYPALSALMARVGYDDDAATFHGVLCGVLCRQKADDVDPVQLLDDETPQPPADAVAELHRLREETIASLTDLQSAFMPILPDDASGLADRARALGAWCEGFLYGLAGRIKLNLRECSEEVREIVKDFTEFTRSSLDSGDDDEVEEGAYAELVEYIRVGAQLVFMELHPRHGAPGASPTIH